MATTNDPEIIGANIAGTVTIPAALLAAVLYRANPHNGTVQIDASEPADLTGKVAAVHWWEIPDGGGWMVVSSPPTPMPPWPDVEQFPRLDDRIEDDVREASLDWAEPLPDACLDHVDGRR